MSKRRRIKSAHKCLRTTCSGCNVKGAPYKVSGSKMCFDVYGDKYEDRGLPSIICDEERAKGEVISSGLEADRVDPRTTGTLDKIC